MSIRQVRSCSSRRPRRRPHAGCGVAPTWVLVAVCLGGATEARSDENRRGFQVEGMVGLSACIDGRVDCRQDNDTFDGRVQPSFGTGATAGFRLRWLMIGGLYRWGMFNPRYSAPTDLDYSWGGQHTIAGLIRPILPIWRFDLGLNLAPGFSRQVFRRGLTRNRDYTQGFAFLLGPIVTVYVTERVFIGAEVDAIFSAQRRACRVRQSDRECFRVDDDTAAFVPTHQMMGGLVIGGTFL